jgi:DNA invertase Pin-like site-specific DNA recombinase
MDAKEVDMSLSKQGSAGIGPAEKAINAVAAESGLLPSAGDQEAIRVADERLRRGDEGSRALAAHTALVGYASVEANQSGDPDSELQRQAREIRAECERRELALARILHDRVPPRQRPLDRPGLGYALQRISARQAGGLVVAELSSLSRALPDLGRVLEWLMERDVRVIAVASRIDTQEEAGRLAIRTIVEVSQWERQRLAERTRAGMRAARRKGPASVRDDPGLKARIAAMRAAGMTLQAIANQLNADGIPTLRGGAMWRPSSVQTAVGYQRPVNGGAVVPRPGSRREGTTHELDRGA